jgi:hypothetical protein
MMDMLEKFIYPTDETAEKIKSAMTSSAGHYEAVPVNILMDSNVDIQSTQAQTTPVKIKGSLQSVFSFMCVNMGNSHL